MLFRCIPTNLIENLAEPTVDFETSSRQFAEKLRAAGLQVQTSEPGGFFFIDNGVDGETQQRYINSDKLIRLAQMVRNSISLHTDAIITRGEFIDWLEDQGSCDEPRIETVCSPRPLPGCDPEAR